MIVPRFFIVEATGPGRVTLHGGEVFTPQGSREPIWDAGARDATLGSEARSWKDVFGINFLALLVSQKVADDMRNYQIRGATLFSAKLLNIHAPALKKRTPPPYYWTQLRGGIQIDPATLWEHGERRSRLEIAYRGIPVPNSWSGEDLFLPVAGVPFGEILCTRRFLKAAYDCQWNGLRFWPIDLPRPYRTSSAHAVDYLKRKWPPKWYPDGVEGHPNNLEEVDEP